MAAQAGILEHPVGLANMFWIHAFAGMTRIDSKNALIPQ